MARARNIKPGFFDNEELGVLPCGARLMFIGLWTLADRAGRLEDRPARIAGKLFAYDRSVTTEDVDQWLNLLARSPERFIIRYEVCGQRLIQVSNFAKHQSPHVKEQASTIPAPDMPGASPVHAPDKHQPRQCVAPPDSLNPDSGLSDSSASAPASTPPPVRDVLDSARKLREFPVKAQYELDETYQPIVDVAREFWPDSIREDFVSAHFAWSSLSWEQKQEALANLRGKQAAEPGRGGFVKKNFAAYMTSAEWKRKPREPTAKPKSHAQLAAEQRLAALDRVL